MARLKTKRSPSSKSSGKGEVAKLIRKTRQASRKRYTAEEKIRIVMEGLRAEASFRLMIRSARSAVARGSTATCITVASRSPWKRARARLKGDEQRGATRGGMQELQQQNERLKQLVAELSLESMVLEKSLI
jgi:transposase